MLKYQLKYWQLMTFFPNRNHPILCSFHSGDGIGLFLFTKHLLLVRGSKNSKDLVHKQIKSKV